MNDITLKSFNNDHLASTVFLTKYALRDKNKNYLEYTLKEMNCRMINSMIQIENKFKFTNPTTLDDWNLLFDYFSFGGRTLNGLGNILDENLSLANCYVLKLQDDSLDAIIQLASDMTKTYRKGGGVGVDISTLRPNGSWVNNKQLKTTGASSFIKLYSTLTGLIGQQGRRGALLVMMKVTHPDILEFIKLKNKEGVAEFCNISIAFNKEFMDNVIKGEPFVHHTSFELPDGSLIETDYDGIELWNAFVENNWRQGDPGGLFWDTIIKNDPASNFERFKSICVNPCGEQNLEEGGMCNLGSILLHKFVKSPFDKNYNWKENIDWNLLKKIVRLSVKALDNIVEENLTRQALEIQVDSASLGRRIGLGITGLADMFALLNTEYDSEQALEIADEVMRFIKEQTVKASIDLAVDRGAFKYWYLANNKELNTFINDKYFDFLRTNENADYYGKMLHHGIRNIGYNTIAPNGSISIIHQCSGGVEPIFKQHYVRTIQINGDKEDEIVYHPVIKQYKNVLSEQEISRLWKEANDIDWKNRVKLQGVLQKHISQSISSTVNLPSDVSKDVISEIYKEAYRSGLKGITVYRDKSKEGVLNAIPTKKEKQTVKNEVKTTKTGNAFYQDIVAEGKKWKVIFTKDSADNLNGCYMTSKSIGSENYALAKEVSDTLLHLMTKYFSTEEIENQTKKTKESNVEKIARYIGYNLKNGVALEEIIDAIESVNPPIYSFVFQVKKQLQSFLDGKETNELCPECNTKLTYTTGCKQCMSCGFSKCE